MIDLSHRSGQHLAVLGLGGSGIAAAQALAASGVTVTTWDDNAAPRLNASDAGLTVRDLAGVSWDDLDGLVMSPGIPLTHPKPHPVAAAAMAAARPVLGDIELLAEVAAPATTIAITGTNGKSTTTALVHHILKAAGRKAAVGGNLGPPALDLEHPGADGFFVLELSSYQLDLCRDARFDIAVLLNITPDHIDRHGDMAGYVSAKGRIFRDRSDTVSTGGAAKQIAVIGIDDEHGRAFADDLAQRPGWQVIPVSVGAAVKGGACVIDGQLFDGLDGATDNPVAELSDIETLPGAHNWQNAAAAYAICRAAGLSTDEIVPHLAAYPGLPHRQEIVGRLGTVRFINDSKATNGEATAKALSSYEAIYWIAGGIAKADGLGPAAPYFDNVRHAFLIGEAAESFADEIGDRLPITQAGDLATATRLATEAATADGGDAVVLLSPAAASFDQFPNFGARGDAFRACVAEIVGEDAA